MLYSFEDVGSLVGDLGPQRDFERSCGLPWHRTVAELESEYGIVSWRGFQDVIPLRGVQALGFDGAVEFRHRVFERRQRGPVYEFLAELNPYREHRQNHKWALNHLAALFGRSGQNADVSNCLCGRWDFGLFEVCVRTFLPDKRYGSNLLYDRNPDLWQVTNLTVESRLCAYREPVAMDLLDGFDVSGVSMGPGEFLTNRLLVQGWPAVRVWRNRDMQCVGVANRWGTIVRPMLPAGSQLLLNERTPARGGGSASLELDSVKVLGCSRWDGLREVSRRVAKFWGVGLETYSQPDE